MAGDEAPEDWSTPVGIERVIRDTAARLEKSAHIMYDLQRAAQEADLAFDKAFALAANEATGSQEQRKRDALIATEALRDARDIAEAQYQRGKALARALEHKLEAARSAGASVRGAYQNVGR
ncbi:hypothetical protein D2E83_11445 [Mycobacteroides abscessus]|nr:hypothetical protein DDJ40_08440 [Mycobacteroides abscessus]RIU40376.1 hypothetical protein D2E83_11445 [Mycobacteroides abscessus]